MKLTASKMSLAALASVDSGKGGAMSASARGKAPAAARVAKARVKTTLNCILLSFLGCNTEHLSTEDCF
jgi:hypothetical protein